jgi:hypothetical protein
MKVAKRMKMRKTYIIFGSTRMVTRRDRGTVRGEDRLETREARGEGMLDLCIKHLETAMLQPVPRQDQRLLIGLRASRVIHLQVTRLHHLAVVLYCWCSGYRGIPVHLLLGPVIGPSLAQGRINDPSYGEDPHEKAPREENDGGNC